MPTFTEMKNGAILAPGLAISSTAANVKYGNTFRFKANGRMSAAITTADAPSLLNAPIIAPYPSGTTAKAGVLATAFYRIYALIGTVAVNGTQTVTPSFSWIASADFDNTIDLPNLGNAPLPDLPTTQAVIGWVVIQNATGSNFTPGTTSLSTSNLTVTYIDNTVELY